MLDFPPLKWIVVCSNGLIFAFLVILMCEHYYAGNNLKSWSFLFYILSFCWLALKLTFWSLTVLSGRTWEAFQFYVLYWVPVPIEICSFMLVPLFFVNIIHPRKWKHYKIFIRPVYIVVTCGMTILTIIWSLESAVSLESQHRCIRNFQIEHEDADDDASEDECFKTEYSGDIFRFITASCFLFLTCTQAWFGVKLHYITDWQQLGMISIQKENLTVLNIFLCFSFISRVLYQILAIFFDFSFADIPLDGGHDIPFAMFLILVLWDYLPALLLLLYVVSPSLQGVMFASRARSGSRNLSVDEGDGVLRDRADTGYSSDGDDVSSEGTVKGLWVLTKNTFRGIRARLWGGGGDSTGESRSQHVNYGATSEFSGYHDFRDRSLRGGHHDSSALMASNRHVGELPGDSSTRVTLHRPPPELLRRFQQPPHLPQASSQSGGDMRGGGGYPYQAVDQDSNSPIVSTESRDSRSTRSVQLHPPHPQSQSQPQPQAQPQPQPQLPHAYASVYTTSWGNNMSNAAFDPDLYAFSAIPHNRPSGSLSASSMDSCGGKGYSPLDHLQRDTSAHKYASYAPHAPPTPVTVSSFFGHAPEPPPAAVKSVNPPSNLDNALGAFKNKTVLKVAVTDPSHFTLERLMSPSAMSHGSPSETPTEFTLTSRLSGTTPIPDTVSRFTHLHSEDVHMHMHRPVNQGPRLDQDYDHEDMDQNREYGVDGRLGGGGHRHRPPLGHESSSSALRDRGGQLSSRPVLRNASGNFLNLVNLAEEEQQSGTNGGKTASDSGSGSGCKSINSSEFN